MLLFGMYYRNHLFSKYLNVQSGKVEKWKSSSSVQTFLRTWLRVGLRHRPDSGPPWIRESRNVTPLRKTKTTTLN